MNDIALFRTNALPQRAQSVLELDRLSGDAGGAIQKMERGNQTKPRIIINVE